MTPRHPPRALRGLTTPIAAPLLVWRRPIGRDVAPRTSLPGRRRLATRPAALGPRLSPSASGPAPRGVRPASIRKGPRSWRVGSIATIHSLRFGCLACVTDHRIVREQPGGRRPGPRPRPVGRPRASVASSPRTGRRPGGEAAHQRRPRPAPGGARRSSGRRPDRAGARLPPGGRRAPRGGGRSVIAAWSMRAPAGGRRAAPGQGRCRCGLAKEDESSGGGPDLESLERR